MALSIYILLQPGSVISEATKMGLGDTETCASSISTDGCGSSKNTPAVKISIIYTTPKKLNSEKKLKMDLSPQKKIIPARDPKQCLKDCS